jgi:hypothetical protein
MDNHILSLTQASHVGEIIRHQMYNRQPDYVVNNKNSVRVKWYDVDDVTAQNTRDGLLEIGFEVYITRTFAYRKGEVCSIQFYTVPGFTIRKHLPAIKKVHCLSVKDRLMNKTHIQLVDMIPGSGITHEDLDKL